MLMSISACSNDSDELLSSESAEMSRSTELVSEEVTLTTAGTLSTSLTKDPATLQKLKITGPINAADVECWKTTLTNLVEFDLSAAVPTYTDGVYYKDPHGNDTQLSDNQVGGHMFSFMTKLEKIVFPSVTTDINWEACNGCTALKSADIPANVTYIGNDAFRGCAFTSVTVPANVVDMSSSIFADNLELQSVKFLANRTSVPSYTFYHCPKLTTVVLADRIEEIGGSAFDQCSSLKDFTPFVNIKKISWFSFNLTAIETADLSNVTEMGECFRECKSLKTVVLPPTMTSTPGYAFWGCDSLTNITWPTALETISDGTFGGAAFTELNIPATVKSIGYQSFHANRSLTKITLPEGLETISDRAFTEAAFTEISIPSTVTKIGGAAFESSKLKMLTIPATVTEVSGSLINGCSNLSALVWNCAAPVDDTWGVNSNCYLFIPNADVVVGPNWKNIVVNGVAEVVELCKNGNRSEAFSIPVPFTAKKITFTRNFDRETVPGESSGWQTIVLPFTPTKIEHETKGVVAPFNSQVEGAKPFWLRELTAEGFVDKTTIEPNKAYIIAMPNHNDYVEDYRLNGMVTFSAENVELAATPDVLSPSVGPEYSLQPTYNYIEHGVSIYALNNDYWIEGYHMGSVFVRNTSDIYAFEAYATLDGRSARSLYDIDTKSKNTRSADQPNKTGIPQIGDM